ncbi:hypothetical protein JTE90_002072 [Oedothorax gibbosus]|uniref:Uncharacterized protein n=1 Tax=Oedothorax gibbosus TaxID=931172 RepID=A0AAV6UFJ8_9ARAC|nr:hypothetical protein JTE90_002072 [Oedothorax gibbosus]
MTFFFLTSQGRETRVSTPEKEGSVFLQRLYRPGVVGRIGRESHILARDIVTENRARTQCKANSGTVYHTSTYFKVIQAWRFFNPPKPACNPFAPFLKLKKLVIITSFPRGGGRVSFVILYPPPLLQTKMKPLFAGNFYFSSTHPRFWTVSGGSSDRLR